ncbi:DUF4199 domain-containing protein [Hymenobacter sp. BRD67]|uniref:DUF4199 domain-containing protein n=1 Tax=Hymenobacter sp. BRD67 TaxID=2675877 RepID=UPI001565957D|nr:DUF4199 domain-containing protein [Hymenobacter sp. BRD67]QKG51584.1 DUF4199 domain-containing protein [Hymenobacter sp. BRD67]
MQPEDLISRNEAATDAAGLVRRLALRFGVGAGIACASWLLFLQLSGNNALGPKQLLGELLVPMFAAGSQWVLRRKLAPEKPGVGRSLAVGGLTVLLAATIAAASMWSLAHGAGEPALARNRAEQIEIVRVQQEMRAKEKRNQQFEQDELRQAASISVATLARGTFTYVLILGMLGGVPSGLFLRK